MCHIDDEIGQTHRGDLCQPLEVPVAGGERLPGVIQRAEDGTEVGRVLLITDIYGPIPFYVAIAGRLADAGYTTFVPNLFFREGELSEQTRDAALARAREVDQLRAMEDLRNALTVLRDTGQTRVGVLGFCLGGTLALDLTPEDQELITVSYYGFPDGVPGRVQAPAPAEIADQIHGPILAFWGKEDYIDMDRVAEFSESVEAAGVEYEWHLYDGAGHGFLKEIDDSQTAAADSWRRTLDFLDEQLIRSTASAGR